MGNALLVLGFFAMDDSRQAPLSRRSIQTHITTIFYHVSLRGPLLPIASALPHISVHLSSHGLVLNDKFMQILHLQVKNDYHQRSVSGPVAFA